MSSKKKKGLVGGLFTSILIPIILSAFANQNINNENIRRVVLFCYSIRFELVFAFIIIVFLLITIPLLRKMIKKDMFLVNTSILVACIFLAFPVCFINLKRIVYDRRMFYDRGYYMSQIQYLPFKKGNELFSEGEFEKARDKYSTVVTLQKSGYYSHAAIERIGYIDSIVDFREALFSVLNPDKHSVLTVTDYRGMILLKTIFPGSFDFHLDVASGKVRQAILDYIQLYDAVKENDYDAVKELIGKNGWCWFEQDVWEMFSVDDRDAVMEKLSYYLAMETEDDAIKRLRFKWSVEE